MHTYVQILCVYVYAYVCLYVSEINDSNNTRDERKESGYFVIIRYLLSVK